MERDMVTEGGRQRVVNDGVLDAREAEFRILVHSTHHSVTLIVLPVPSPHLNNSAT